MHGWVKIHRDIFDSDLWNDVTTFRLFLWLIGKAAHRDGVVVSGIELKRGQYLRSYRKLAEDLAYKEGRGTKTYSLRTIKKCINKLISDERVNVQETEQGTLFTIVNYDKYQGLQDIETETVNALSSEVETNGKRTVNKNKNNKKNNNKKDINYTSKIKDLLTLYSEQIPNFVELNKQYWDVIRETRKSGKIAESVIYNTMKKWEKYHPSVIRYALKTHIEMHAGKREEYTLGIMRNTTKDEAEDRLDTRKVVSFNRYRRASGGVDYDKLREMLADE